MNLNQVLLPNNVWSQRIHKIGIYSRNQGGRWSVRHSHGKYQTVCKHIPPNLRIPAVGQELIKRTKAG